MTFHDTSRRDFVKLAAGAAALAMLPARARADSALVRAPLRCRCLFNHELLIVAGREGNSPEYIGSFVARLKDTDVDAVMCCPTAWRTNLFPSRADPLERNYRPASNRRNSRASRALSGLKTKPSVSPYRWCGAR